VIRETQISLTCNSPGAGAAVASGDTTQPLVGILRAVHVDHAAGGAGTTDFTLTCTHSGKYGAPTRTLMAKADSVADGWFYPVAQKTGPDGAAVANEYGEVVLNGVVTAALAQANDAQTAVVTLVWDDQLG
jgi:hypothetical protein